MPWGGGVPCASPSGGSSADVPGVLWLSNAALSDRPHIAHRLGIPMPDSVLQCKWPSVCCPRGGPTPPLPLNQPTGLFQPLCPPPPPPPHHQKAYKDFNENVTPDGGTFHMR